MRAGLQIFDENGKLSLDTIDRAGRVLGVISFSGHTGSHVDSRLLTGQPFWFFSFSNSPSSGQNVDRWSMRSVTVNGSRISWEITDWAQGTPRGEIFYGVF